MRFLSFRAYNRLMGDPKIGDSNAPGTDAEKMLMMAGELEDLRAKIEELKAENLELRTENERLRQENKRLEELSTYDPLTGILNRRGGREIMDLIINGDSYQLSEGKEKRREKKPRRKTSFLMLDIDNFKGINDTYGHEIGDLVLKKVAEFLKNSTRKQDVVSRWGGEEFLLAFHGDAQSVINKFFDPKYRATDKAKKESQISLDVETEKGTIKITLSGGVTDYQSGEDLDGAIKRADEALYESKDKGRNMITKR